MDIITKLEAKVKGLTRFFTGRPCKKGHISERMVSDGYCVSCKQLREKFTYAYGNRKSSRTKDYQRKRESILRKLRENYNYTEEKQQYQERWRTINHAKIRQYQKDNAGLYAYHAAKRRKKVKLATPVWFDYEKEEIRALYMKAARLRVETGIEYHVDHIIPLSGKNVCGLHTLANLQIITRKENLQKTNKLL